MVPHICSGFVFEIIAEHAKMISQLVLANILKQIFRSRYSAFISICSCLSHHSSFHHGPFIALVCFVLAIIIVRLVLISYRLVIHRSKGVAGLAHCWTGGVEDRVGGDHWTLWLGNWISWF